MKKTNTVFLTMIVALFTLGSAVYGGDMENNLNQRQKNIVGIAASTAVGNLDLLSQELNSALDV
jgi:hypothetical protein